MARITASLCAATLLLSGCGTLFSEPVQPVVFTSDPQGADVIVNGAFVGHTPVTVPFDRDTFDERIVVIRTPGYATAQFRMSKALNTIAILNLCSLLSWATDAFTGGLIEYSPNAYFVELQPAGGRRTDRTDEDRAALAFVLVNTAPLLTDIARGDGEYLRTLATLLAIEAPREAAFVAALQAALPLLLAREYPYQVHAEILRVASAVAPLEQRAVLVDEGDQKVQEGANPRGLAQLAVGE